MEDLEKRIENLERIIYDYGQKYEVGEFYTEVRDGIVVRIAHLVKIKQNEIILDFPLTYFRGNKTDLGNLMVYQFSHANKFLRKSSKKEKQTLINLVFKEMNQNWNEELKIFINNEK